MKRRPRLSIVGVKFWQRLSLTFITILLVTVVSETPSFTQVFSSDQLKVISKIEATATLDYQSKLINVDHAVEEHGEEATKAGLSVPKIRKIYKLKIANLNQANPWQQWQPFGWAAAAAMGTIALFRDAIIKKLSEVSKAILDNFYKQFSGTKLFRNFALQRYRTALSSKYQELKIPFRPNRPLKMVEVYIPLQLLEQGKPIDVKQAVQNFKRLMIVGQPGSGKTMLLKSLALNYANGPWDIPQQPVAIFLELNRLSDTQLTIEQQLVKALERDDFPNGGSFVEQGLKQGMIMLLFDGLDEVNSSDRPNVVRRLQDFIGQYNQCRVAITCRTQVYKQEFDTRVDQTVGVVEFNDQQIQKFLHPWKQSMNADKSVEQLLQALQDRPRIMELARNPLMLTIIAYLYTDTAFILPHSRAEFYQKATDILLETWDEVRQTPNRYKGRDKKLVLRHLALYGQDQTQGEQQDRRHLTWRDVNDQVASILPDLNLKVEDDLDPILKEICERSGLMMLIDGGEGYQFTHLTLQEFFAATQLIEDVEGLIERFNQDPDVWRETIKLWCGLAGDSTALIRAINHNDRVMAFSCLADAQKIEPDLATEIIDHFKRWLRSKAGPTGLDIVSADSAIKAFGAVAADQRLRGQDVFDFLAQALSQGSQATIYAAQGLAATNIPEAAQVLANHYLQQKDIQPHLVRMGDLAVSKLEVIAKDGHISAIQHLGEIGTLLASRVLVILLGEKHEIVAFHAALQLATLLKKPDIEEDLVHFPQEVLHSSIQNWQGIWKPFDKLKKSSISVIAEQIIDQLVQGIKTKQLSQIDFPDLDPRIVLPICIFSTQTFHRPSEEWIDTANTLLENTEQEIQLEINSPKLIRDALKQQPQRLQWDKFLRTLPLKMQLDLLYRLSANRSPTKKDWQNLYTTVNYDLRTSWHYRLVVTIVFFLSTIALYGAFDNYIRSSESLFGRIPVFYIFFIVPTFWLVLFRGTEQALEPNLFISLGLRGPITFCREYGRLLRNQIVWNGVQAIFNAITNSKNILYLVLGVGVITVVGGSAFGTNSSAIFVPLTLTSIVVVGLCGGVASGVAGGVAGGVALCGGDTIAFIRTVVLGVILGVAVAFSSAFGVPAIVFFGVVIGCFVLLFAGVAVAFMLAENAAGGDGSDGGDTIARGKTITFGIAFGVGISGGIGLVIGDGVGVVISGGLIVAGSGIGYWVRQTTNQRYGKYLAILAAPFFCGSPIVVYFSTSFLYNSVGYSWLYTALIWLGIVSVCTLLMKYGRQQEQLAQNPLMGILPDYNR